MDEKEKNLNEDLDDCFIENNDLIGQEEEDFEKAFNQIFLKNGIVNEGEHEDYQEMECHLYYLKGQANYIQKEESNQIIQRMNKDKCLKNYISNKDIIEDKEGKKSIGINQQNNSSKNNKNSELFIGENNTKGYVLNDGEEKKIETNNIITTDLDKQNKFRVYSLNDFNVFHPGGNVEFFKQIKEKFNDEINNSIKEDIKSISTSRKFKIYKEKNKKSRKKTKQKKKRKEKPDDIRKKIKSRFLKTIKNRVNQMLKIAKSEEYFDFLPQCFICNISKQKNKSIINMTFKELMSQKFFEEEEKKDKKKISPDKKKYDNNVRVLKYLENNEEICKKSNFNVLGNMTFKELFREYLKSEEFEKEIEKLKEEQNNDNYIIEYIIKAYNFINYFSNEK
jgi:hypothetical protein